MRSEDVKEILDFSISDTTRKVVNQAFRSEDEIYPIDCDFSMFRLFKPNSTTVNLEFSVLTKFGMSFDVSAQFTRDGRIVLPYKYFQEFVWTRGVGKLASLGIYGFSPLKNAMMAAFSIESLLIVQFGEDAKETINGMEMEFYKVEEGELNIFAHDRFGLDPRNPLAIGKLNNGRVSILPTITYDLEYRDFLSQGLLSSRKFT